MDEYREGTLKIKDSAGKADPESELSACIEATPKEKKSLASSGSKRITFTNYTGERQAYTERNSLAKCTDVMPAKMATSELLKLSCASDTGNNDLKSPLSREASNAHSIIGKDTEDGALKLQQYGGFYFSADQVIPKPQRSKFHLTESQAKFIK